MQQPRSLLLDADIVIKAYQLGIWDSLKRRCRIAVVAIVAYQEAKYFKSGRGTQQIRLSEQVAGREVCCLEATAEELICAVADFASAFTDALHDGEKEALALLVGGRFPEYSFCTGDINAIQAAGMLGVDSHLVSFETLIKELGLGTSLRNPLPPPLTEATLRHHIEMGKTRRITREYFKS